MTLGGLVARPRFDLNSPACPVVRPDLAYYFPFHEACGGSIYLAEFERAMSARVRGMDANDDWRYSWAEVWSFYVTATRVMPGAVDDGGL